jgi:hypothetical protein
MLACITEIQSPAWRAGMIEGLTRCHALAAGEGLRGAELLRPVIRRFNELTPPAYHAYCTAYLHQSYCGVMPKMLSFWQWRYLAIDLYEIVQVAELLGCGQGRLEEEARAALLLDDAVPGREPYQSLLNHGGPVGIDPQYHDGLVDAYNLCWEFQYDCSLDGDEYIAEVLAYLDAFWPDDYKIYRNRSGQDGCDGKRTAPLASLVLVGRSGSQPCPPLEYGPWSALVDELAAEIARCTAAGAPFSRKRVELSRRLLCRVDEPAPSLDWTLPAKLEQELAWK